jgi:N-acetyl-anhydromuramyl-L-alanine amidase AmpD
MATQIRPNRLEVSDRFPMLGFTVRTDGNAKRYEIAIGTSPELFGADGKGRRSRDTFYSTRAAGPLPIERGESVYVLPSDILARFVGQKKLYYGLATFSNGASSAEVVSMPKSGSPYINLAGLTGRSLQRVRVLPSRQRAASGYGRNGSEMEWAGDAATPGTQPTTPMPAKPSAAKDAASVIYDDGYGPLPPPPVPPAQKQPEPQAKSLADDADQDALHGIDGPIPDDGATAQGLARSMATDPEYPLASRFEPTANYRAGKGTRQINRIVIHITDGSGSINGTIGWFQNTDQRNSKGKKIYASAHYIVGRDGEVVQMVRNNDISWHASAVNDDSIGIEHEARSPGERGRSDKGLMPTEEEYCASAALVNWLCNQFNLPMDRQHIVGHNEASPRDGHTDCPDGVWDWDYYMGLVTSGTCYPKATASSLGRTASSGRARQNPKATGLAQVVAGYTPTNTQEALQYQQQFQDRKQAWAAGVQSTSFFPHSAICALRMTIDGDQFSGTGFYIGDDRILTCGHNLAGASSLTIIPGKNGDAEPFGSFTASPSDWVIHPKFNVSVARSSPTGHDFDLAVIKVNTPPPNGEAFRILEELLECQDSPIIVCGYAAGTVDRNKQHLDGDAIRLLNNSGEVFMYNLQTEGGTSGSPVYYVVARDDEARQQCVLETHLVGVHVDFVPGSSILNEGCRLTADKIAWINSVGNPYSAGSALAASNGSPQHHKRRHEHLAKTHALADDEASTLYRHKHQRHPGKKDAVIAVAADDSGPQPVKLPHASALTGWDKKTVRIAVDALLAGIGTLVVGPVAVALPRVIDLVNNQGYTIGLGIGGDAGLLGGAGLGFGILLAPNDEVGLFGDFKITAGLLDGISAGTRVIVMNGGIDAFNDTGYGLGVTLDTEVGASVTAIALFDSHMQFNGVSFELGVGASLTPIQIFTSAETSVSAPVTQALADSDEDSFHGIDGPIPDDGVLAQAFATPMAPEYPQASRFEPADSGNYRAVSSPRTINRIVIHITDGGKAINGTVGWFKNPAAKVSAHYVIGQDGEVVQMVKHNDVAWHASSANGDSIGIEHVANVRGLNPTPAEYCASAALVNWLCSQFDLPMDRTHVLGHSEADPRTSHKGCPNAVWDWDYYMGMVTSATCPEPQTQALSVRLPAPPRKRARTQGLDATSARTVAGSPIVTVSGADGNVSWELDQFPGAKGIAQSPVAPLQNAATIQLNNWPYCDHTDGTRSCAWFRVDWKFSGQALGEIRIAPAGAQPGTQPLRVEARIEDGKDDKKTGVVSLAVRFTYVFSTSDGPPVVAKTELILYSDGSIDQKSNWMAGAAA